MNAAPSPSAFGRFLDYDDLKAETTLSRWTIWRRVKDGTFPPPVPIGGRRKAWAEQDVEEWKAKVAAASP